VLRVLFRAEMDIDPSESRLDCALIARRDSYEEHVVRLTISAWTLSWSSTRGLEFRTKLRSLA
jgi:hypothetical protein